ncbi:hypothetical protein C8R43DRAFT_1134733 [Mycena crocata]|nr:hypothetical protein C8R43DRAFT_1134733 [Mycena crocata]
MCMLRISERRRRRSRSQSANRNRQCCCTVAVYNSTLKPSVPAFKPCLCVEDLMAFPPSIIWSHIRGFNAFAALLLDSERGTIAVLLRVEFQPVAQQTAQHFKFESSWDFCHCFEFLQCEAIVRGRFIKVETYWKFAFNSSQKDSFTRHSVQVWTDGCNLGLQSTQVPRMLEFQPTVISIQFLEPYDIGPGSNNRIQKTETMDD